MKKTFVVFMTLLSALFLSACSSSEASLSPTTTLRIPVVMPPSIPNITVGETLTIPDIGEFTVESIKFVTKVSPSKPDGFYLYYQTQNNDQIALDIKVKYKNLQSDSISTAYFASLQIQYDNKYNYDAMRYSEELDGSTLNIWAEFEPLTNYTVHFITELPKEASNDSKSIIATFTIDNKSYLFKIR